MFLCSTPMPPARAIAMAISDSVTVSMAAETSGMLREIVRVKRLTVETSRGCTAEYRGTRSTSSNVRPGLGRMTVMGAWAASARGVRPRCTTACLIPLVGVRQAEGRLIHLQV